MAAYRLDLMTQDHPRIRGEHARPERAGSTSRGSSPHTRGAPAEVHARVESSGIIPAYAGSTGRRRSCGSRRRDHPRIRGEHIGDADDGPRLSGSSPHTRGAHGAESQVYPVGGIIPAYAGSTRIRPNRLRKTSDHPRIRGEHE